MARRLNCSVLIALVITCGVPVGAVSCAKAEVRLGRNVHIGGHNFSNQTYSPKRRLVVHLYDRTPRNQGCAWRTDRGGGRVKVCHLRRN
jgi:hypothetical protein